MATLRELRKQAKDFGIAFEKTTKASQLEEMIAEKMCEAEAEAETETPARTPIPSVAPVEPDPALAPAGTEAEAVELSFSSEVGINEGDLNEEFKKQASKYANFAKAEAVAKANVMTAKLRAEVVDAEMTKKIRAELIADGNPKPTEKMVLSRVIVTKEYRAAQQLLIQATTDAGVAKGFKEAFAQRKDMLIQLGSSKRQEVDQIGMHLKDKVKGVMSKAS